MGRPLSRYERNRGTAQLRQDFGELALHLSDVRIRAAIWENETKNGILHNVTVSRLFKNDDDEWQDSTSFGRDDLPLVGKVLDRAHSWIFANNGGTSNGNGNGEEDGETPF